MSYTYSVAGFALAVFAVRIASIGWPAVVVAGLGMLAGFGYAMDGLIKRFSMHVASGHDSKISPRDFLNAPQQPDDGYRLVRPSDDSREQLYPYVDLSDHSLFIQLENPDLTRGARAALYARWYGLCPEGFMHLEKLVDGQWRPISVSIVLPLSIAGYRAITALGPARRSVVDLGQDGILRRPSTKHQFLLIDTWIVDREGGYGGQGHGKSATRGGNANLLVLRHIAQFWNSANRFRQTTFLVETANPRLLPALEELTFRESGTSKIDEAFYQTTKSQFDAVAPAEFARVKKEIRAIEAIAVVVGTAPVPTGWYYH